MAVSLLRPAAASVTLTVSSIRAGPPGSDAGMRAWRAVMLGGASSTRMLLVLLRSLIVNVLARDAWSVKRSLTGFAAVLVTLTPLPAATRSARGTVTAIVCSGGAFGEAVTVKASSGWPLPVAANDRREIFGCAPTVQVNAMPALAP